MGTYIVTACTLQALKKIFQTVLCNEEDDRIKSNFKIFIKWLLTCEKYISYLTYSATLNDTVFFPDFKEWPW